MYISIEVTGDKENIAAFNELGEAIPRELPDAVQMATFPLAYTLASYDAPAVPTYTRTGEMAASVYSMMEINGDVVSMTVGGNEELHWTRGDPDGSYPGAYMHVGRWRTFKDIVDTFTPVAVSRVEQWFDSLVRRIWGK